MRVQRTVTMQIELPRSFEESSGLDFDQSAIDFNIPVCVRVLLKDIW